MGSGARTVNPGRLKKVGKQQLKCNDNKNNSNVNSGNNEIRFYLYLHLFENCSYHMS